MQNKLSLFQIKGKLSFFLFAFVIFSSKGFCTSPSLPILDENAKALGRVQRLTTPQEHAEALEEAIANANKTVLVTNYGNLYPSLLQTYLFQQLIPKACKRNVKIYFRLNYDRTRESSYEPISSPVQEYLTYYGINVAWTQTHAKIVAVDHKKVIMGSFNWLTDLTSPYASINSSFIYEGKQAYGMTERVWEVLKYYRNKEFSRECKANYKKAYLFKRSPLNPVSCVYLLEDGSSLTYVPLIDHQRYKLLEIFEQARQRIVVLSPFVSLDGINTYQKDFVKSLLINVLNKNLEICFVCLPEHEQRFRSYLDNLLTIYPKLMLLAYPNLHAKTLIRDNNLIAEGSFNWLCAARDETYSTHKHEATLVCEGPRAQQFVREFYKAEIGKFVSGALLNNQNNQLFRTIRKRKGSTDQTEFLSQSKRQKIQFGSIEDQEFFANREEEVERDLWIHHPFWINYSVGYMYLVYKKYFEIMSGKPFDKEGYCVRINKQHYILDDKGISYFETPEEAKKAAFSIWKGKGDM